LLGVAVLVASVVALLAGSAQAAPAVQPTWSMAAHTSFTRTYAWVVHKSVSSPSVTLAPGQTTTVGYTCPPPAACPRTIGYWKTHDGSGPQADVVSSLLPVWLGTAGGPKSVNVTSTALSNQLLSFGGSNNVVSSSNGINKLYTQLLAAKLNGKNGADISSVASTIAAADAFLATHNSTDWNGLSKSDKAAVLAWMTALDDYNSSGGC
jgi:hypothetical protein